VKVFLTGGTGFIGGHVARRLRARGDEVRALVRNPGKAESLAAAGCELVEGDLGDEAAIGRGLEGAEAAIHGAAIYEVGIPRSRHRAMYEANVRGTERVLRAALDAGTPRVVYVSTVAAFGNTRGRVVDETYEHPGTEFTSYYEQTKHEAHRIAKRLIAGEGLPCVIVQPAAVYGPRDHSAVGQQIRQAAAGKLPALAFPDLGLNMVHVEDVASGILLALDRGEIGESYVLGGEITTLREVVRAAAEAAGRRPPRVTIPAALLKLMTPAGPLIGKVMGQNPNLGELISSADGVTFWAKHDKAMAELGYAPRGLEQGIREALGGEGRLAAAT
jgi:nucleoside-diphosphate-sugar epimerase